MRFFENIKTVEQLKKEYHKLCTLHHPDNGGNSEIMKEINGVYTSLFNKLKFCQETEQTENNTYETPEEIIEIIDKLVKMQDLQIEICGSWIWISGNTYPNRTQLKEIGCKYAPKKKLWYWHNQDKKIKNKKSKSIEEIREKYGSQKIFAEKRQSVLIG